MNTFASCPIPAQPRSTNPNDIARYRGQLAATQLINRANAAGSAFSPAIDCQGDVYAALAKGLAPTKRGTPGRLNQAEAKVLIAAIKADSVLSAPEVQLVRFLTAENRVTAAALRALNALVT